MTLPASDADCIEAYTCREKYGTWDKAAVAMGVTERCLRRRAKNAVKRGLVTAGEFQKAADNFGVNPENIRLVWRKDEEYSVLFKNPATNEEGNLLDLVRDAARDVPKSSLPKYEKRKTKPKGNRLLVLDLADVHFRKLCVKTETGYEYNREIARHRVIEGTKALLRDVEGMGIGRVLFVMGNDVLHTDNAQNTTTSGTPQDTEGSIFEGYRDAKQAMHDAIKLCADVADVDLIHCMSNHDWLTGWALTQNVAAMLANHPNVNYTEYSISEVHRKYYRYENNLIGLSHGDGAKEEKLYGCMVKEAREHISACKNLYWLLHHVHHKDRKQRGSNKPYLREKDHNGMTAIISGNGCTEGDELNIEYVRSPSPPDGWHDRNGYLNRQGVECFVFDPYDGMKARFTEFF